MSQSQSGPSPNTPALLEAPRFFAALLGNPNTGKTTLFNRLAGMRQRVGNYPGVTVEKKTGILRHQGWSIEIIDLPGTYSLAARSPDEFLAVDVILGSQPLRMLIDTGATMMSLPWDVAMALINSGDAEYGPKESFRLADGSIREQWTIIIHRMTIGSHVLTNVSASVAPTGATPLLGFTILNRVGRFTIDVAAGQLTFG